MKFTLLAMVFVAATSMAMGQQEKSLPPLSSEGRFIFANDDDWDWASPLGGNEPSKLSTYGKMPWSALDWLEEGLDEVRGMLVGTPPAAGGYLTMGDLNRLRGAGPKKSYEQIQHKENRLANLLRGKNPPNLVILMRDLITDPKPWVSNDDIAAALEFVQRGGRLLVLSEGENYRQLVSPFLDSKKFPPLKPPTPLSEAEKKKVLEFVGLLDSPVFKVREKTTAALLKKGKQIVPLLEAYKPITVEQAMRINQLVKKLKPLPLKSPDGDPYMTDIAKTALQLHQLAELKTISRDGQNSPGSALCLRLPVKNGKS